MSTFFGSIASAHSIACALTAARVLSPWDGVPIFRCGIAFRRDKLQTARLAFLVI